jgi:hypothetical protein
MPVIPAIQKVKIEGYWTEAIWGKNPRLCPKNK